MDVNEALEILSEEAQAELEQQLSELERAEAQWSPPPDWIQVDTVALSYGAASAEAHIVRSPMGQRIFMAPWLMRLTTCDVTSTRKRMSVIARVETSQELQNEVMALDASAVGAWVNAFDLLGASCPLCGNAFTSWTEHVGLCEAQSQASALIAQL